MISFDKLNINLGPDYFNHPDLSGSCYWCGVVLDTEERICEDCEIENGFPKWWYWKKD